MFGKTDGETHEIEKVTYETRKAVGGMMNERANMNQFKTDLEEGELYAVRKGKLEKLSRNDDGMRKVRITEDAYKAGMEIGHAMKLELHGYKPDISIVVSALLVDGSVEIERAKGAIRKFTTRLFQSK